MGMISVIVGGQYGSESKGAVTGFLVQQGRLNGRTSVVVRVAGPNAGHTAYDEHGRAWALRQIPVGAVTDLEAKLVIGAGSEIDPPVLFDEVGKLEDAGIPVQGRLFIDGQATIITDSHKAEETGTGDAHWGDDLRARLGSTGKGIGAARADRLMRNAETWESWSTGNRLPYGNLGTYNTADLLAYEAGLGRDIYIEGTQGYGLGLHAGHYPQCTSSDCRAIDFLAMAGITPWHAGVDGFQVWVVCRAFPIRVAGNSGPLKDETTWEALGLPEERTTVTKKVRRVGGWDIDLVRDAVRANGGGQGPGSLVRIAFAMADQMFPEVAGLDGPIDPGHLDQVSPGLMDFLAEVSKDVGAGIGYIGTGPNTRVWFG